MPRCTNCNYKWRLNDILKISFAKKGKKCPNCKQKQYLSGETQRLFTLGWVSLMFIPFLLFRIKLSDKEESLL
ncbi:TIGR04104 family putative zinc finger protein [Phocicoccus pinnipedialis]|uniref:TIGR04104 family putative zinc finger protein n=1 Tax=Phocicoccus pinnipedialis TaxID=110845 RepID=UPI00163E62A4|nr:TIGR04104 family putative zinc finger protein [Jeotgalicoccus pinnipedialis]